MTTPRDPDARCGSCGIRLARAERDHEDRCSREAPPALGMITMIDREAVKPTMVRGKPVWGWTYRKAGFVDAGETMVHRKLVLRLQPSDMPSPQPALQRSTLGLPLFSAGAAA